MTEWEFDELAISCVVDERIRMRLTGPDRVEAIRRLSAKGLQPIEIAPLLGISHQAVSQMVKRHHMPRPPRPPGQWWCNYMNGRRERT